MCLRISLDTVNIFLCQRAFVLNCNVLLFSCCLVNGTYLKYAIHINIEWDLNLWDTTACRSNTIKVENTNLLIVIRHRTLTLQTTDCHRRLIIHRSGENLSFLARNCCVCFHKLSHNATHSLNTKRKRCHIKQENIILIIPIDNWTLYSSAKCDSLIKVNVLNQLDTKLLLKTLLNKRDTTRTTNKQYSIQIIWCNFGFLDSLLATSNNLINYTHCQLLKLGTCQRFIQMDWSTILNCNVRKTYLRWGTWT